MSMRPQRAKRPGLTIPVFFFFLLLPPSYLFHRCATKRNVTSTSVTSRDPRNFPLSLSLETILPPLVDQTESNLGSRLTSKSNPSFWAMLELLRGTHRFHNASRSFAAAAATRRIPTGSSIKLHTLTKTFGQKKKREIHFFWFKV